MRWLIGLAAAGATVLAVGACASISGLSAYQTCDGCGDATTHGHGDAGHSDGPGTTPDAPPEDSPDDVIDDATDAGVCTGGQIACDGGCIDPSSASNCGACGNVCSGTAPLCTLTDGGTFGCGATCTVSGQTPCNGQCVDLTSNPNHCGACSTGCSTLDPNASPTCVGGVCAYQCNEGFNDCPKGCAALNTSSNCGACGISCAGGTPVCTAPTDGGTYRCANGCAVGQIVCNGACVDTTSTATNCGGCAQLDGGHVCSTADPNGLPACVNGKCTISCNEGYTVCGGACSVFNTSANCGSCGSACAAEAGTPVCSVPTADAGADAGPPGCVSGCPGGKSFCSGACVDETSDPQNCNICGNKCPAVTNGTATCSASVCGFTCNTVGDGGYTNCGNACADTASDKNNCGACGHACAPDSGTPNCSNSACTSGCGGTQTNCSGSCVDVTSDLNNCGACATKCTTSVSNATATCSSSTCGFACKSGYTLCNGACVNEQTDNNNCGGCGSTHACASPLTCQSGVCACSANSCGGCIPFVTFSCCKSATQCGCHGWGSTTCN